MLQVYKDKKDFDNRQDKTVNGVTAEHLIDIDKTIEEVEASMVDCEGCFNCYDCTGCINCKYCKQCTKCTGCYMCEKCDYCEQCKRCTECKGCSHDTCVQNAFTLQGPRVRKVRRL